MGMNIADTFADSNRQVRRDIRTRIFAEQHAASVRNALLFALIGMALWGVDWAVEPGHPLKSLAFRGGAAAVLLLAVLIRWLFQSLYLDYVASYLSFVVCEIAFVILWDGQSGGLSIGAGQLLYFFVGSVLVCRLYSFNLNLVGCVILALAPHLVGAVATANFPHLLYASTLWPVAVLTIVAHWRIRPLLVENVRLRQEIDSSVLIDPVTGLLNYRGFDQAFQRLAKLGESKPLQQFLLLVEIDGLETVKMAYGEQFAHALRGKMGEFIDLSFRGRDITASPSEEEYACILQNISREKAFDIAERFRESVVNKEFECAASPGGKLSCTVSIGIVSADTKEQVKTLLNRARIGISQAKSLGGNQCVCI